MLDLLIKNGSCFLEGNLAKQDIGIKNGKLHNIGNLTKEKSRDLIDAEDKSFTWFNGYTSSF